MWGPASQLIWVRGVNDHRVDRAGGSASWLSGMADRRFAQGVRAGFGPNEGRKDLPKSCARGKWGVEVRTGSNGISLDGRFLRIAKEKWIC